MNGNFFKAEEIFRFNPKLPEAHASTIAEMPNGDLLLAWFAGFMEAESDVAIYSPRLVKTSGKWTEPKVLADTEE